MTDLEPSGGGRDVALVELLDRALGAGVVITGDVTISLADVPLVYLNLRLLLGSVDTLLGGQPGSSTRVSISDDDLRCLEAGE